MIRRAPAREAEARKRHVRPAFNVKHPAIVDAEAPVRAQHRPRAAAHLHVGLPRDRDRRRKRDAGHHVDLGVGVDCA